MFHPLLMPPVLFILMYQFSPTILRPITHTAVLYLICMIFILTSILPLLLITILRYTDVISSFSIENRKERITPFIFICGIYLIVTILFFTKYNLNDVISILFSGITILLILITLTTFLLKVSVHAAGICGLAGFILGLGYKFSIHEMVWPFMAIVIVAGMVLSTRLYLKAHTQREIYLGSLVGFVVCFATAYFFV